MLRRNEGLEKPFIEKIFKEEIPRRFVTDIERIAVIDGFIQFSQNPTSASAGYGIEGNYPFIKQNLIKRYHLSDKVVDKIISFIREAVEKMRQTEYDIYFWRDRIGEYVIRNYKYEFLKWYRSTYRELDEIEKKKFIFLLYALRLFKRKPIWSLTELHKWYMCFFDKEETTTQDALENLLVKYNLCNVLYYRSSRGYEKEEFIITIFIDDLCRELRHEIPITRKDIENYFSKLTLSDLKMIELCAKREIPVLMGSIAYTYPFIVEKSKSYFAISPFALNELREHILSKKKKLTDTWKEILNEALNSIERELYPYAEKRTLFEGEGAYCWEIKYTERPDREPLSIIILLIPYIFNIDTYRTIIDEIRRETHVKLNLIFIIKETLPSLADSFRYVSQKNLIFLLDERTNKFYVIERSEKLNENDELLIDSFLSRFLPLIRRKIPIEKTWPPHLKEHLENLEYYSKFPRLIEIRNKILDIEPRLRDALRRKLKKIFGEHWKEELRKRLPNDAKRFEKTAKRRPDRERIKDLLDGATLGDLVKILRTLSNEININKRDINNLDIVTTYRKILIHPINKLNNDIDEATYKRLKIALKFIEDIIIPQLQQ